jgi:hypothetical protein
VNPVTALVAIPLLSFWVLLFVVDKRRAILAPVLYVVILINILIECLLLFTPRFILDRIPALNRLKVAMTP